MTQHIIPAAYPRRFREAVGGLSRCSSPFSETAGSLPIGESKEERTKRTERELQFAVNQKRNARPWADANGGEQTDQAPVGLWIAADRWTRDGAQKSDQEGITLVVKHANGFSKEASPLSYGEHARTDAIVLDPDDLPASVFRTPRPFFKLW